jgi:hypothetical protein
MIVALTMISLLALAGACFPRTSPCTFHVRLKTSRPPRVGQRMRVSFLAKPFANCLRQSHSQTAP